MEQNQQVLATAFRKAKAKIKKIEEFRITPDFTDDQIDDLVIKLCQIKALELNEPVTALMTRGQTYYVELLVEFSGMTPEEKLDSEYENSFADSASKEDMLSALS